MADPQQQINSILKDFLLGLANAFRNAERYGAEKDEPEGARFIKFSESSVEAIADKAEQLAARIR